MDRRELIKGILGFFAGLLGFANTVKAEKSPIKSKSNDFPPDFPKGRVETAHIFYSEKKSEFILTLSFHKWEKATERDISAGEYISSKGEVFNIYNYEFTIKNLFFNGKDFYWRDRDREHLLECKTEELCRILRLTSRKNWLFKRRGKLPYNPEETRFG